jgi:PAS domain-containing protein
MLGLKNGTASSFNEVCEMFTKEDAHILRKYADMLRQEGKNFEDLLHLKAKDCYVVACGNRINGNDNNLYCDVIWFRDVSRQTAEINRVKQEQEQVKAESVTLENLVDGLDEPVWIRNENLELLAINKKYAEYAGAAKSDILSRNIELGGNKNEGVFKKLALTAQKTQKIQKKNLNIVHSGKLHNFIAFEKPYFVGDTLDKIGTIGYLKDNTELEKAKRGFAINQNNHLEILGVLGTAFAIFDSKMKLYFYNNSFKLLWNLENEFLDSAPTYLQFLETVREQKMLPPVPDFKNYRDEEISIFNGLIDTQEDLLHLPDGRTVRRLRTPHPNGVIFAFEDVSDRLATTRRLNELTAVQQNILDNLTDAVIIFGANQRLKFYNRSYLKLWGLNIEKMQDEPKIDELISYQKLFFSDIDDWDTFKATMIANIMGNRKFTIVRDDNTEIMVSPQTFYDGSIMVTYSKK